MKKKKKACGYYSTNNTILRSPVNLRVKLTTQAATINIQVQNKTIFSTGPQIAYTNTVFHNIAQS